MVFAKVAVPVPLGQAFTYSVPQEWASRVVPGARVLCDFGRRQVLGVVLELSEQAPNIAPEKLKPLRAVVDSEPVLPTSLLDFLVQLAHYYLAPIGEVMRLALPTVARGDLEKLKAQGVGNTESIKSVGKLVQFAVANTAAIEQARNVEKGRLKGAILDELNKLVDAGALPISQLEISRSVAKKLVDQGLIQLERRSAAEPKAMPSTPLEEAPLPTEAQRAALAEILETMQAGTAATFLLHGVTGSGKTEIYLNATARCLEMGRSAIVLVPEIALTPQLVQRFKSRLGDQIAVLHSGLSPRERRLMWQKLRDGTLRVAVGARSALFAPVENLALICVDEEHDSSFKQEDGVQYSARDMALLRAHRSNAVCLLGSATPSLQSEALRRAGKIRYLSLPLRARAGSALPKVEIVDLRRFGPGPTGDRLITLPLFRALEQVLERKQQAILFLNRRGFAPSLVCEACGEIVQCPNCAVALTVHTRPRERMVCHYCDFSSPVPKQCSACKSARLSQEGVGTEAVESSLVTAFPHAQVGRLDRDVAAGTKSEPVLARMRRGEIDILVGTQMVTKGHDLPRVTLVGVLNADAALSLPDYQAAERTFQLLVQVAGRAGRGEDPGRVLVQTHNPDHPAVRFALKHDVAGFMEHELAERRQLHYPPYARLALVRLDATDRSLAERAAHQLAEIARKVGTELEVLGPTAAPLARLRGRYRFRFLLRAQERAPVRKAAHAVLKAPLDRRVRLSVDIDPLNML
ncbi:MAG TPA: primosomal protein N' [Polyangiaceae bacterium]|nr:primosomal protein N' [Polyangiaceae bacterium]